MILIDYEEYTNDYCRNFKQKQMMDLGEFADWIFGLCKGKYEVTSWISLMADMVEEEGE